MNKKFLKVITSFIIGGGLIFNSTYANAAEVLGYDTYKLATENTFNCNSLTAQYEINIVDSGNNILNSNSVEKINNVDKSSSEVTINKTKSGQYTIERYKQDNKLITKSSEDNKYLINEYANEPSVNDNKKHEDVQKIIDAILKDSVDSFNIVANDGVGEKNDGSKHFSANLDIYKALPLENAITSYFGDVVAEKNSDADIPKLVSNIGITKLTISGDISNDNLLQNQTAVINLSGCDDNEDSHELVFTINLTTSNVNSTTPDKVDLSNLK